jgi:transcriptional antiterminator RfaH
VDLGNEIVKMNDSDQENLRLWYVVQTKPGNEDRVQNNLQRQEIENFLPRLGTYEYRQGTMVQRIKPLFPNYLFAKFHLGLHYYKVKWTRGVNRILGNGGGPVPISGQVISMIREKVGENDLIRLEDGLKEGDVIQVTSGPFKDLRGIFQKKMSSQGRVKILLSLIGIDVPVQISQWQVKRVA